MKVTDIMSKNVDYVFDDTKLKDVAKLIFGRSINGAPVVDRKKKLVGFVTEKDILSKFYPSMQEYVEDPVHSADFESMEGKVDEILDMSVSQIMSKHPTTVTPDTPLLRAQSLMFISKVGRLPVIDDNNNLVGIVSKGDIFKAIVGERLSFAQEEEFYDWLGSYYDELYDWKERLDKEIPDIANLFKKEKVRSVLDIASSTGEHSISLASKGFKVIGLEASSLMHNIAEKKRRKLPSLYKDEVTFLRGQYKTRLEELTFSLDAAIFMGNALSPVMGTDKTILEEVVEILNKENPILVFQLINFEKLSKIKSGFRDFTVTKAKSNSGPKYAILSFYTGGLSGKDVFLSRAVFELLGRKWMFRGIRSTPVISIGKEELVEKLKKLGFSKFNFYGSALYQPIFKYPFDPLESDWLNIVAKK